MGDADSINVRGSIVQNDTTQQIYDFAESTLKATKLLYDAGLYGHLMVVIYSAIDSMGLLDAPASQTKATGETFKSWTRKYILTNASLRFTDVDFWAARCAILHTFTSQSDLSDKGTAKQIQYYSGPKETPIAQAFVDAAKKIDNGSHVPVNIEDTYLQFLHGMKEFIVDLQKNCEINIDYENRLRNVIQQFNL